MRCNKAQGLSVSTIILIALGLIVLVAITFVITGKLQIFGDNIGGSCRDEGGIPASNGKCTTAGYPVKVWMKLDSGKICTQTASTNECEKNKRGEKGIGLCCIPIGGG